MREEVHLEFGALSQKQIICFFCSLLLELWSQIVVSIAESIPGRTVWDSIGPAHLFIRGLREDLKKSD